VSLCVLCFPLRLTCHLLSAAAAGFIYCSSLWGAITPPTPADFVHLGFSRAPAPPLFSSLESYQPATVAVLVHLVFVWGTSLPPLSGGACRLSATVADLAHPKLAGTAKPAFCSRLVYKSLGCLPPPSPELKACRPLCYVPFSILYYSVCFFYFVGQRSVCPGGYAGLSQGWLWEYRVLLTCSPVGLCLPSRSGASVWRHGSPPGFSV
jgi:hypothetical protein